MREFMDYVQSAFYGATGWNRDNSYSTLNATVDALLSFPTPRGVRLALGSLASPQFATAYQLGTVGAVDGSVAYLYSTAPLDRSAVVAQSARVPLPDLLRGYRPLVELRRGASGSGGLIRGWDRVERHALAYGRLYLPQSMLEALVVKRLSPALQMQVSAVSNRYFRNGGTLLGMIQYDTGRYGVEGLASSDGGLLGVRGLYNFGGDVGNLDEPFGEVAEDAGQGNGAGERERIYGRFSTGAELYYGTLNKSGGMSVGARFATLPTHKGTPLTATMTINPLMGNISWSYAVQAGRYCSLASRMDFNVYSYESDWAVGMELWRKKGTWLANVDDSFGDATLSQSTFQRSFESKLAWKLDNPLQELDQAIPLSTPPEPAPVVAAVPEPAKTTERSFRARMEWRLDDPALDQPQIQAVDEDDDEFSGVLKLRLDQHLKVGLLWEGRVKSLLFSLGSAIDLRRLDSPFRSIGLEVQFSS